ncbi:MAG: hypothetical protein M1830_003496, partial [Pleopsidium flavum]
MVVLKNSASIPDAIELDIDVAEDADEALEADMELEAMLPVALLLVLVPEEVPVLPAAAPEAQVADCGTWIFWLEEQ